MYDLLASYRTKILKKYYIFLSWPFLNRKKSNYGRKKIHSFQHKYRERLLFWKTLGSVIRVEREVMLRLANTNRYIIYSSRYFLRDHRYKLLFIKYTVDGYIFFRFFLKCIHYIYIYIHVHFLTRLPLRVKYLCLLWCVM